jgi:hypothetical protein
VECCLLVSWLDVRDKKGKACSGLVECKAQKLIALGPQVNCCHLWPATTKGGQLLLVVAIRPWLRPYGVHGQGLSVRMLSWNKLCISVA